MDCPHAPAEALVEGYESLRQEVLSCEIGSRLGLGVLLGQGMVGWMKTFAFCQTTAAPLRPARWARRVPPVPSGLATELTQILTTMILARKEFQR